MTGFSKKVIVRLNDSAPLAGYLPTARLLNPSTAAVELLDTAGRVLPIALKTIRFIAFVRDFNLDDRQNPERLARRTFLARPRTEGLWLRLTFSDGELLEGLAALDASLLNDAADDQGIFLIPPDVRSNTQRLFVPRMAIAALQLLAVITTPSKPSKPSAKLSHPGELTLPFPEPSPR